MEQIEREGLIRPESFDLFLIWYSFGGQQQGLSLTEIMTLDAALITDFSYILRKLAEIRSRHDHLQKVGKDSAGT